MARVNHELNLVKKKR